MEKNKNPLESLTAALAYAMGVEPPEFAAAPNEDLTAAYSGKTGYMANGLPDKVGNDTTFYAVFWPTIQTLSFDKNGGSITDDDKMKPRSAHSEADVDINGNELVLPGDAVKRSGYWLKG